MSKKRSRNKNSNNSRKNQKNVYSNEVNEAVAEEKLLEAEKENATEAENIEAENAEINEQTAEPLQNEAAATADETPEAPAAEENVQETGDESQIVQPVFEEFEVPGESYVFTEEGSDDEYARYETDYAYEDDFDDVEYDDIEESVKHKNKKKNKKNKKQSEEKKSQTTQRKSGSKNNSGFNKFIAQNVEFIKKNPKAGYAILATVVLLVVVVIVIVSVSKKNRDGAGTLAQGVSENGTVSGEEIAVTQQGLQMDAYPEVNEFVTAYLNASAANDTESLIAMDSNIDDIELVKIRVKSEYVESYDNVVCYTKPGPYTDSYIVYAVFDVKLYNWDIVSPGLNTLLICTDENGKLYSYSGFIDENIAEYINEVSSQTDVVDLMAKVDAKYHEVLDENIEYAEYIAEINQSIKTAVGVELAAASIIEDATPTDADLEQAAEDGLTTFEVKVTDTVNVRASDSEIADKIDQVTAGTILNCYEQQANGWSKIDYNGEIAYISSQYLERLDFEEVDESQAIGTVKIKETVNIRSEANTDATILGAGYAGETYPQLSEDENGWTKIIYNGREAYVKSEYLE